MDLELKDKPGQLVLALQPISDFEGNIVSVVHHREKKTPRGAIPVQVAFDIVGEKVNDLIDQLKKNGIIVARVGEERLRESMVVILIGHIVHSDIRGTIDQIDATGYAEVVDLAMSMPGINQRSSARMVINAAGKKEMESAVDLMREIACEKDLLLIEPI